MENVDFLILGAGPAGLAFAHTLLDRGIDSFVVLEKENEAGGLCRSTEIDGAPLDIGGGHFLDVRRMEVLDLLFRFMPENEWTRHDRVARIRLKGTEIDHPLEGNIWQLPVDIQADYLESIARAGCVSGEPTPDTFEDWCRWKFGLRIADDYMLPYNLKLWRMPLSQLGTYWLDKLPNVSFRQTLLSCLERRMQGALPAHGEFLYPKRHGYGEVWRRMGQALRDRLRISTPVCRIDAGNGVVNGEFKAKMIVNSIPWTAWSEAGALPRDVANDVARLVNVPIDVDYHASLTHQNAHWIYEPDESVSYHRILVRSNFAHDAKGGWTETNASVSPVATGFRHRNEYAYPVNTADKPEIVRRIHAWARDHHILPLGRWGQWEHMNSDIAVACGIKAATSLPYP